MRNQPKQHAPSQPSRTLSRRQLLQAVAASAAGLPLFTLVDFAGH